MARSAGVRRGGLGFGFGLRLRRVGDEASGGRYWRWVVGVTGVVVIVVVVTWYMLLSSLYTIRQE